jgi:Domain of unknown function (DUF6249)
MGDVIGHITGLVVVTLLFGGVPATIVLIYYFGRRAKHKERMALIEKGMDPAIYMKEETPYHNALVWGTLILGIGLGAFLGYILSVYASMEVGYVMPTLALVFGGSGLIGYYVYRKKAETKSPS